MHTLTDGRQAARILPGRSYWWLVALGLPLLDSGAALLAWQLFPSLDAVDPYWLLQALVTVLVLAANAAVLLPRLQGVRRSVLWALGGGLAATFLAGAYVVAAAMVALSIACHGVSDCL